MTSESERREQPKAPSSVEPTPASQIAKRLLVSGIYIFFGCMLGSVYLPYLFGDPSPMERHHFYAIGYFLGTCAVSAVFFVVLLGLDRRRVRRATEG